jgi:hypothetical protein
MLVRGLLITPLGMNSGRPTVTKRGPRQLTSAVGRCLQHVTRPGGSRIGRGPGPGLMPCEPGRGLRAPAENLEWAGRSLQLFQS